MRLLTIPEAAQRLGLSIPVIRELAESRELPVRMVKTRIRIPEDLLLQWSQTVEKAGPENVAPKMST